MDSTKCLKRLDGRACSKELRFELATKIQLSKMASARSSPHLVILLVGNDDASEIYIEQKRKVCQLLGMECTLLRLPSTATIQDIQHEIDSVNSNPEMHGLIVQLPLPEQIHKADPNNTLVHDILARIAPEKDVDGFHPQNIGNLLLNRHDHTFKPATPYGIELLLKHYRIPIQGRHVVILGKSLIVGQPLMNLFSLEKGLGATVTACDRNTVNLDDALRLADVLIVATGKHHTINRSHISCLKRGVVIIDVGMHRIADPNRKSGYRLEGDVDAEAVRDCVSYITPVPGGVGPMTVIALLMNTYEAYLRQQPAKVC